MGKINNIDKAKIERFFKANETEEAIDFKFYDINGCYATQTKKPYVKVEIILTTGELFSFSTMEFESFGERTIKVGIPTRKN